MKKIAQSLDEASRLLLELERPLHVLQLNQHVVLDPAGTLVPAGTTNCLGIVPPVLPHYLGDPTFLRDYGVRFAYYAGAMANGINSEEMVIALGERRILSAFGAGGLSVERVGRAIKRIKEALPEGPYAINLLHNPGQPGWEMDCVKLFIENGVSIVEASAYLNLSSAIVYYRVKGLARGDNDTVVRKNRVIAKISRREVAQHFLNPPPEKIVSKLLSAGLISEEQAELSGRIPMADDITVEGDSGGHTDNGVLSCIYRSIAELRDEIESERNYSFHVRVGAAGGIGSPHAVSAAFALGAAYVVTGSINQACVEAGTSAQVKEMLAKAKITDLMNAPSADMFEIGAKVQVLKGGTMYALRAQKLYAFYKQYESLAAIPDSEIQNLEKAIFRKPLAQVWEETVAFFESRNAAHITTTANSNPKKKMALLFQWYLGQSSRWAIAGETDRTMDYQIWCGSSMGAANEWLKGSTLEVVANRKVVEIAEHLMAGAAYLSRINSLKLMGVQAPERIGRYLADSVPNTADVGNSQFYLSPTNEPEYKAMETETKLSLKESKEYYEKCWEFLPGGTHYNFGDAKRPLVIPFNRGKGSRIWDLDGNEHLDLFCKFGALFVGHKNLEYDGALMQYMQKVASVDNCDLELEVGALMNKHIPCAEMVRFCLSGTEAVQNALRLARGFTGKNRFIRFHGHYHGNADNIMGWRKKKDLDFPVPEQFKGDLLDTLGRANGVLENQSFILPWNDIEILQATIERYKDEVAAVLMEPICINGGGIFPREGYLKRAKEICEKNNVLLIFDEIITGVRLGLGGAQKIVGVTPHLATFGKALGGGSLPVSAIAGRRDIMDLYTRGKVIHAGTFNGYPLGLAAIKATFEMVERDPGCYDRMGGYMAQISDAFVAAAERAGLPLVVQGMPTALVFHSQDTPVDRSEGYSDKVKFCDIIVREVSKRFGIQFSPLSRIYSNLLMSQDDVRFFEERISDAMLNARKVIDITFKEGEAA